MFLIRPRPEILCVSLPDEEGNELHVTAICYPGRKGSRGPWGEALEPDDPPEMEIDSVVDSNGEEVELDEELRQRIIDDLWEEQRGTW